MRNSKMPAVLVVDDDNEDVFAIRRAFKKEQIELDLEHLTDGDELLDYLEQGAAADSDADHPDLILLDINMPKMDGFEALKRLRAEDSTRSMPVVMYTTSKSPVDIQKAYCLGANSYIVKPHSMSELVSIVKSLTDFWLHTAALPKSESGSAVQQ